jgi:nucleoid DNA-binding protein
MDELVKLVAQKTGISQEHARLAVTTVLDFIKEKAPAPLASQIDGLVSGKGLSGIASGLGGLLG